MELLFCGRLKHVVMQNKGCHQIIIIISKQNRLTAFMYLIQLLYRTQGKQFVSSFGSNGQRSTGQNADITGVQSQTYSPPNSNQGFGNNELAMRKTLESAPRTQQNSLLVPP